jgi:hypothetical protein
LLFIVTMLFIILYIIISLSSFLLVCRLFHFRSSNIVLTLWWPVDISCCSSLHFFYFVYKPLHQTNEKIKTCSKPLICNSICNQRLQEMIILRQHRQRLEQLTTRYCNCQVTWVMATSDVSCCWTKYFKSHQGGRGDCKERCSSCVLILTSKRMRMVTILPFWSTSIQHQILFVIIFTNLQLLSHVSHDLQAMKPPSILFTDERSTKFLRVIWLVSDFDAE